MADAMFAPVVTRLRTYHVPLPPLCDAYADEIWRLPDMQDWIAAARTEPDEIDELDAEF